MFQGPNFVIASFLLAVVWGIKILVDAGVRRRLIEAIHDQDRLRQFVAAEGIRQLQSHLRWGLMLTSLGAGFVVIDLAGFSSRDPVSFGVLFIAGGVAQLLAYVVTRKVAETPDVGDQGDA